MSDELDGNVNFFDFLIAYDPQQLALLEVSLGEVGTECTWNYFSYQIESVYGCTGICPSGLVRIVAYADASGAEPPASCHVPSLPISLAQMTFRLAEYTNISQSRNNPIQFYWRDCFDNRISIGSALTRVSGNVYPPARTEDISDPEAGFPTFRGFQTSCYQGTVPEDWYMAIDFTNGMIGIHALSFKLGDINCNDIPYEAADAVTFANLLLNPGMCDSPPFCQCAVEASDINQDGNTLTISDLVCLHRELMNWPCVPSGQPAPATWRIENDTLFVAEECNVGALLLKLSGSEEIVNLNSSGFDLQTGHEGKNITFLLTPKFRSNTAEPGEAKLFIGDASLVSIEGADVLGTKLTFDNASVPTTFELHQNYPNPFNPSTTISYSVPTRSDVTLVVLNVAGQIVQKLVNTTQSAGEYSITWDGRDANSNSVSSGIYFYQLTTGQFTQSKKMLLLK